MRAAQRGDEVFPAGLATFIAFQSQRQFRRRLSVAFVRQFRAGAVAQQQHLLGRVRQHRGMQRPQLVHVDAVDVQALADKKVQDAFPLGQRRAALEHERCPHALVQRGDVVGRASEREQVFPAQAAGLGNLQSSLVRTDQQVLDVLPEDDVGRKAHVHGCGEGDACGCKCLGAHDAQALPWPGREIR